MDEDIRNLYREMGYKELPQPETEAEAGAAAPPRPAAETSFALPAEPGTAAAAAEGGDDDALAVDEAAEPLPLTSQAEVEELRRLFEEDPEGTVEWFRQTWDSDITEEDVREAILRAEMTFQAPDLAFSAFSAELAFARAQPLPGDFDFDLIDLDNIPITPGEQKFETKGDARGWFLFTARPFIRQKLGLVRTAPFRWHNHPDHPSEFTYEMADPAPDDPVKIALFSDFGTGLYHSLYIARQLAQREYPYAVHLGDIYYAGRRSEFRDYFEAPLEPALDHTELFTLNANHEMLSGGFPYFDYIDRRRNRANQRQQGSYFCLRSDQFQVIGIDTVYFAQGRYQEPGLVEWLEKRLQEGRDAGRLNILLSPDHAYEYEKHGHTPLLDDLTRLVQEEALVDLWFWGNTHYCALFDRSDDYPFLASCIGHGGYPYTRKRSGGHSPAPLVFLETRPRFPEWTGVRQDRGNNGYCVLSLNVDGSLALAYVDWMGNTRFTANLAPDDAGRLQVASTALG